MCVYCNLETPNHFTLALVAPGASRGTGRPSYCRLDSPFKSPKTEAVLQRFDPNLLLESCIQQRHAWWPEKWADTSGRQATDKTQLHSKILVDDFDFAQRRSAWFRFRSIMSIWICLEQEDLSVFPFELWRDLSQAESTGRGPCWALMVWEKKHHVRPLQWLDRMDLSERGNMI